MNLIKKIFRNINNTKEINYRKSYSQCGEDLIISGILDNKSSVYLDIGAHHPYYLSNTYLFYESGSTGVCVEPDPILCDFIKQKRSKDKCLNVGIGTKDEKNVDFYIMNPATLNTFSKKEAENYAKESNHKIEKIIQMPLKNINSIIEEHFEKLPDLISIDVEGLDFEIVKSINFEKYRPKVLCIETINYCIDKTKQYKQAQIINYMKAQNYIIYADTYINTIFVESEFFNHQV